MASHQQTPRDIDVEKPNDSNLLSVTESGNDSVAEMPLEIIPSTGLPVLGAAIACALATAAVNMEVSIIGTSLVKIVEDLDGFERQGWVVTGYLITYTGMLVIWAKLSNITGRKWANIMATLIFTVFSGGCGAAQTMNQLIILRAFQGIGAAGIQTCGVATVYELVPKEKIPGLVSLVLAASALGSLFGPLIGGGLSEAGQWRWVFLINVPLGAVIMLLFLTSMPANFPYQNNPRYQPPSFGQRVRLLGNLDYSGSILSLGASVLLVTVILEGGVGFAWDSATSIALFVVSGVLFILFGFNEWIVSSDRVKPQPLFPWNFVSNRIWLGILVSTILCWIPYNTLIIQLPQRFQIVEGDSAFRSGVRLIPFNLFISIGAVLSNVISGKLKLSPIYVCWLGATLETVGVGLMITLPTDTGSPGVLYFFEILAGLGIGLVSGIYIAMPPYILDENDRDLGGAYVVQMRIFGGALGLSIASTVLNNYLSSNLNLGSSAKNVLGADPSALLESLSPAARQNVVEVFGEGYRVVVKIMTGLAAAQILTVMLMFRKPQVSLAVSPAVERPHSKNENAGERAEVTSENC